MFSQWRFCEYRQRLLQTPIFCSFNKQFVKFVTFNKQKIWQLVSSVFWSVCVSVMQLLLCNAIICSEIYTRILNNSLKKICLFWPLEDVLFSDCGLFGSFQLAENEALCIKLPNRLGFLVFSLVSIELTRWWVDKMMAVLAKCIQIDVKQCRPCWSHIMYTSESEQSSWYRSRRVGHWSWTKIILYHCRHHFRLHWACFGYVELVSPLLESNKSVFIQMSTKYRQLFQFLFKEGKHPMSLDSCLYMRISMESLNIKCYVTPFLAAKIRNMFSKIGQSVL